MIYLFFCLYFTILFCVGQNKKIIVNCGSIINITRQVGLAGRHVEWYIIDNSTNKQISLSYNYLTKKYKIEPTDYFTLRYVLDFTGESILLYWIPHSVKNIQVKYKMIYGRCVVYSENIDIEISGATCKYDIMTREFHKKHKIYFNPYYETDQKNMKFGMSNLNEFKLYEFIIMDINSKTTQKFTDINNLKANSHVTIDSADNSVKLSTNRDSNKFVFGALVNVDGKTLVRAHSNKHRVFSGVYSEKGQIQIELNFEAEWHMISLTNVDSSGKEKTLVLFTIDNQIIFNELKVKTIKAHDQTYIITLLYVISSQINVNIYYNDAITKGVLIKTNNEDEIDTREFEEPKKKPVSAKEQASGLKIDVTNYNEKADDIFSQLNTMILKLVKENLKTKKKKKELFVSESKIQEVDIIASLTYDSDQKAIDPVFSSLFCEIKLFKPTEDFTGRLIAIWVLAGLNIIALLITLVYVYTLIKKKWFKYEVKDTHQNIYCEASSTKRT